MSTLSKLHLSVHEAALSLGISRSQLYKLISSGVINPIKIGARTLFNTREVSRFADELSIESSNSYRRSTGKKNSHRNSK